MIFTTRTTLFTLAVFGLFSSHPSFAANLPIAGYNYSVSDIAQYGLKSQDLFNSLPTSGMDLEHSICSNRSHVWSYELHRKYRINTGTIFIFFGEKVWRGQKKSYWYHAGTYVVENGVELVLEKSYPDEVTKPLTILEWMDNEMEGRVPATDCIEIKKEEDADLTQYFYGGTLLPNQRSNGKKGADCYFRKIPGYMPYPETVALEEFRRDSDGNPVNQVMTQFDRNVLISACIDSYAGRKILKRVKAREYCEKRYSI